MNMPKHLATMVVIALLLFVCTSLIPRGGEPLYGDDTIQNTRYAERQVRGVPFVYLELGTEKGICDQNGMISGSCIPYEDNHETLEVLHLKAVLNGVFWLSVSSVIYIVMRLLRKQKI